MSQRRKYRTDQRRAPSGAALYPVALMVLLATLAFVLLRDAREQREFAAWARDQNRQTRLEQLEAERERAEREASDSFYQKLADGFDVPPPAVPRPPGPGFWRPTCGRRTRWR